jgi:ATP-dependent DNA ligase
MPSTFEFSLPTSATSVPDRPNWLREVKYDGYRMMVIRDGDRVRLISRGPAATTPSAFRGLLRPR